MANDIEQTNVEQINCRTGNVPIASLEDIRNQQDIAARRLIRKLDIRLIPFLAILELSSYIHQVNIGHATILGIHDDLTLTFTERILSILLFYAGYFIAEIPSTVLLRYIGPTIYLSISMLCWGLITVIMAIIPHKIPFLIFWFLLGIAESGFFYGMIIYISLWYRKRERIMRITIFFLAVPVAGVVGGILAYGISKIPRASYFKDWRWILLIEGLSIIPLCIATFYWLAPIPETVKWLNGCEKQILTNILRQDAVIADGEPEQNNLISWRQIRYAFTDWRIYLYASIFTGNLGLMRCCTVYLPSFVLIMSSKCDHAHLWTVPAYVVAVIFSLLIGFSSSRYYEIGYHASFALFISGLGFLLMGTVGESSTFLMYISMIAAVSGTFAAFPIVLSWVTINVGGRTKRTVAIRLVSAFGNIVVIVALFIYDVPKKPCSIGLTHFRRGHRIWASVALLTIIPTLILRFLLKKENNRREHLTEDDRRKEAIIEEPCDRHPDVRYIL